MSQRPIIYWNEEPTKGKPWHRTKEESVTSWCGLRPTTTARWASHDAKPQPICETCTEEVSNANS